MKEYELLLNIMNAIGEKWALAILILIFLNSQTNFTFLKKTLKLTSRTLSRKLSLLSSIGIIKKETFGRRNKAIYTLTDMGKKLCSHLVQLKSLIG